MQLPYIAAKADSVTMVNAFLGVNKNASLSDREFSDMMNLTNDEYPVITNRKKRGIVGDYSKITGIVGGKVVAHTTDEALYYDGAYVCDLVEKNNNERILVKMGAYLVVFPDGIIYNTDHDEPIRYIKQKNVVSNVTATLTLLDGTEFNDSNTVTSNTAPSTDKYWIDTSSNPVVIKVYSANDSSWHPIGTTYVKFTATGIGEGIKPYDAARLSGVDTGAWIYNGYDFNTTNIVYDCGSNFVTVAGFINKVHNNTTDVTIEREMPNMDFVVEHENRLWGCSSEKHEIYACKLGDPTNWNFFGGLDNDSYAVTVGSENKFTGAVSYAGYVMFFKEDGYHKIYGSKPSNFNVGWNPGRGVQDGSGKSIVIVNGRLIFKSRDAVCVYDGSVNPISENLGNYNYYEAVAGGYREKYYVSMRDNNYSFALYVYDTVKGTWTIESGVKARFFAYSNDGLYMLDNEGTLFNINDEAIFTKIFPSDEMIPSDDVYPGNSTDGNLEDTIEWSMTTGDIGMDTPFNKYIKRIVLRLLLSTNTKLRVEVMYDSSDEWQSVMEYYATRKRSYEIPIPVKRCDHMKLRLSGFGDFKLFSIAKMIEEGSSR